MTVTFPRFTAFPVFCTVMLMEFEIHECVQMRVYTEDHRPAVAAVAAVRTAKRNILLSTETGDTLTAFPSPDIYFCFVNEQENQPLFLSLTLNPSPASRRGK